jgi:hypothetical protein
MWPSALVIPIIRNSPPQYLHFGRWGLRRSGCGATPLPSQYVQPESKRAESKRAESKRAESKRAESKRAESKRAESKRGHWESKRGHWESKRGHWESKRGHWESKRGHWESKRGHWESKRGHWESKRGHWESKRGHWESKRGHWESKRGHWESKRGHWESKRGHCTYCLKQNVPLLSSAFFRTGPRSTSSSSPDYDVDDREYDKSAIHHDGLCKSIRCPSSEKNGMTLPESKASIATPCKKRPPPLSASVDAVIVHFKLVSVRKLPTPMIPSIAQNGLSP